MGPIATGDTARALDKANPAPGYNAGLESKIRRAVTYLDEERAFYWEPGGFITAITNNTPDADAFELGHRVNGSEDHWSDIDKRLAQAYYETQTFADYIGAPVQYEEES